MNEIEVACKIYGIRAGYLTTHDLKTRFGIVAENWPRLIRVYKNGLIAKTEFADHLAKRKVAWTKANFNRIGIA